MSIVNFTCPLCLAGLPLAVIIGGGRSRSTTTRGTPRLQPGGELQPPQPSAPPACYAGSVAHPSRYGRWSCRALRTRSVGGGAPR